MNEAVFLPLTYYLGGVEHRLIIQEVCYGTAENH